MLGFPKRRYTSLSKHLHAKELRSIRMYVAKQLSKTLKGKYAKTLQLLRLLPSKIGPVCLLANLASNNILRITKLFISQRGEKVA